MYKLLTAATGPAITLAEAKDQRRILDTSQDALLSGFIVAAQEILEGDTNRALMLSEWGLTLNYFPAVIKLFKCPVQEVINITYLDTTGVEQTLPADRYNVLLDEPAIITPVNEWPSTKEGLGSVKITFSAGYPTANDVPLSIKQAMHLLIGHFEANREENVVGTIVSKLPFGYLTLSERWQVKEY
jgi:uncharacterized phiE125 gp8 family phage protein